MDSTTTFENNPGPSVIVECGPNLKIDEDLTKIQVNEVSNAVTLNNSESSDKKSREKSTRVGKPSLKRKKPAEERPLKRKKANPLPISQMVMESIKALRKRNGASVTAILDYMEGQYKVNAKLNAMVKRYVSKYLLSAVEKGTVEQLSGGGSDGRFKIKKVEKITKVEQKLKGNQKMVKEGKVTSLGQKLKSNKKEIKAEKVAKADQKLNHKKAKGEKVAKVK